MPEVNLGEYILKDVYDKIEELVERSAIRSELINVSSFIRQVGKTHALITVAKKYDVGVIIPNGHLVQSLREKYDYKKIYTSNAVIANRMFNEPFFADEGTNIDYLAKQGVRIVTGYATSKW
jgi:hypothetical protein